MERNLFKAFRKRDTSAIHNLMQEGADINKKDKNGCSMLGAAVKKGKSAMITLLLEHGAEVKSEVYGDLKPLEIDCVKNKSQIFSLLSSWGVPIARQKSLYYLEDNSEKIMNKGSKVQQLSAGIHLLNNLRSNDDPEKERVASELSPKVLDKIKEYVIEYNASEQSGTGGNIMNLVSQYHDIANLQKHMRKEILRIQKYKDSEYLSVRKMRLQDEPKLYEALQALYPIVKDLSANLKQSVLGVAEGFNALLHKGDDLKQEILEYFPALENVPIVLTEIKSDVAGSVQEEALDL